MSAAGNSLEQVSELHKVRRVWGMVESVRPQAREEVSTYCRGEKLEVSSIGDYGSNKKIEYILREPPEFPLSEKGVTNRGREESKMNVVVWDWI